MALEYTSNIQALFCKSSQEAGSGPQGLYWGGGGKKVWSDWVYFRMRTIILEGKYVHHGLQTTCSCPLPWGLELERGLQLDQKEPWTSTVCC